MAPEALTFVEGADATIPATTSVVVETTNQGKVPVVFLGYEDGSNNTQLLGDVDGIPVQGSTELTGVSADTAVTGPNISDTTSSTEIIAANPARIAWSITNTSSARAFVKFGSGASATSHIVSLAQWETRGQGPLDGLYKGAIYIVWASDPGDGVGIPTEW